jgi:hypothetical protein
MGRSRRYRKLIPSEAYVGISGKTGLPYGRVKWKRRR